MADKRPWAKIDTGYTLNPKWFRVERYLRSVLRSVEPIVIRNAIRTAKEAHLASILFAAQNQTDGLFPVSTIKALVVVQTDEEEAAISALFEVGLWVNHAGGMAEVHDYLEHQQSAEKTQQLSAAGKAAAEAKKVKNATNRSTDRLTEKKRRDKKRILKEQSGFSDEKTRPDILEVLDYLDAHLVQADLRIPNRNKTNISAVRLMIDTDGHPVEEIKAAIDWTFRDEFWRTNIRSASKLREKWGQLRGAAERNRSRQQQASPLSRSDQAYIAELQRLRAEEAQTAGMLEIEGGQA